MEWRNSAALQMAFRASDAPSQAEFTLRRIPPRHISDGFSFPSGRHRGRGLPVSNRIHAFTAAAGHKRASSCPENCGIIKPHTQVIDFSKSIFHPHKTVTLTLSTSLGISRPDRGPSRPAFFLPAQGAAIQATRNALRPNLFGCHGSQMKEFKTCQPSFRSPPRWRRSG